MNASTPFILPKSPLTDEQYKQMLAWYQQKDNLYEMLAAMERTKAFNQEQIDASRHELDDNVAKVGAILKEFGKHHGY